MNMPLYILSPDKIYVHKFLKLEPVHEDREVILLMTALDIEELSELDVDLYELVVVDYGEDDSIELYNEALDTLNILGLEYRYVEVEKRAYRSQQAGITLAPASITSSSANISSSFYTVSSTI